MKREEIEALAEQAEKALLEHAVLAAAQGFRGTHRTIASESAMIYLALKTSAAQR